MNECAKFDLLINAYIDGELSDDDKNMLDAHLETCDNCRSYMNMLKSVSSAVHDTLVQPPPQMTEGIMYKIKHETSRKRFQFLSFGRYTAIAAVFCLVLLGAYKLIPLFSNTDINAGSTGSSYDMAAAGESGTDLGAEIYGSSKSLAGAETYTRDMAPSDKGAAPADGTDQNIVLSGDGETKTGDSTGAKMMTTTAPLPAPDESNITEADPEYAVENSRGYQIYKNLKYDESFYSICIVYGAVPDEIEDCETLYSAEGVYHYKVPLDTMLDLELAEKFDEIYYSNLKATYGLVIVIKEENDGEND